MSLIGGPIFISRMKPPRAIRAARPPDPLQAAIDAPIPGAKKHDGHTPMSRDKSEPRLLRDGCSKGVNRGVGIGVGLLLGGRDSPPPPA